MKGKTLKYIILLAAISVAGVFLIQFGFLKSSYNFTEKKFKESTIVALKEVVWQLLLASGNTSSFDSITPVQIITDNYYIVYANTTIDKDLLKSHLVEEFKKHEIYSDFEFAIFNPVLEQMDEGILLEDGKEKPSEYKFQTIENGTNYFAIHFKNRSSFFVSQLSIWYFLTALLVVIVLFFGYTLTVIIKQRQLSEVQKNFINNLTHELKTPISSIAIASSVLNNEEILNTPERLFSYAKIIQEQNTRLSKNVEKVLNLASLEKNRIHLNLEEINLNEIITEIAAQFKQTDFGQKADVKIFTVDLKINILADRFHFSNLMLNILENGAKYCDQQPLLTISANQKKKNFELAVTDNGIGIPKDQRKKIFTKFYRVPTGNVHNVKGFGLGLDYVQKIASAHKWKIKVDENPKGGSIFTLIIPV
ncbi:MAG TPA: HAMP domain-containing sensor histidine kinase [Draconibacterium sp.]|nr:HAMP domain-containing sensor histidine kinase [Draconibacterium sp.]HRX11686.1 HAMP domain-containing sensor histidine kinase [Draconibacterium sp.]